MYKVKYFGLAGAEPSVYNRAKRCLYWHPWLTDVGGVCRVIILGHIFEVYRRRPWRQPTTDQNYSS